MDLLIIKPSSLGDIVHGLQVAASIKAQNPGVRISWVARDVFAPLVRLCDSVDRVFVFRRHGALAGFRELVGEIRQHSFDAVFDFQGLARSAVMTLLARADRKCGRSDAREAARFFYSERAALPRARGARAHAVEILLQFCPLIGLKPELAGQIGFREEEASTTRLPPDCNQRVVLMFPDSRRPEKRWPGFHELTTLLLDEDSGCRVIWAGSESLRSPGSAGDERFENLTGKTDLAALTGLVRQADWVVSNDSGPLHLAAALGVRTLGIFGPTDPLRWGPYPPERPTNHHVVAPLGDLRLLSAADVLSRLQRLEGVCTGKNSA